MFVDIQIMVSYSGWTEYYRNSVLHLLNLSYDRGGGGSKSPPPCFIVATHTNIKKIKHSVEKKKFMSCGCEDRAILWEFFTNYLSICKGHLRPPLP